jgi:superfamily II DNA/RNA helicase
LPPLKKNIYNESSVIKSRSQSEVTKWLNTNQVNLSGENVPRPVFEFSESGFPEKIIDQLYGNYEHPTVIQSISWPVALSGRDMISIAKTGSGKTLGVCYF